MSLEKEVNKLRLEIKSTQGNEGWCQRAGDQTHQELKRLRVALPATELERDRIHGENLHLINQIEKLELNLQKELGERDHWKQNIEELRNDIELLDINQMENLANIEHIRFHMMQQKNVAEQYVINNNTIELENQTGDIENSHKKAEKDAAKRNILYFENERDSLAKHITKQKKNVNALESQLAKLKEENEELRKKLEKEKSDGNPFLEMLWNRSSSYHNLSMHARGSNDDHSHKSTKSFRFVERIKMISSRSVRSDPHISFPFQFPSRRSLDLEGRMVTIDETGNKR